MSKIKLEKLKFSGQIEKEENPKKYIDTFNRGVEEILNLPPYNPTKKIKTKYSGIIFNSRTINAKITHNWIGYLVTDNGTHKDNDYIIPMKIKGYILDINSPEKLQKVKNEKLENLASEIGICIGKGLIE